MKYLRVTAYSGYGWDVEVNDVEIASNDIITEHGDIMDITEIDAINGQAIDED